MKKLFIILSVLFLASGVFGAEPVTMQEAEKLYQEGKFRESSDIYQKVLAEGKESAKLYYNLGNCYYKLGENTQAILNYERALLLNPSDGDIKYNLKMAERATVDKISVMPEFFVSRWYKSFVSSFSADQWAYVSVGFFLLFLGMAALFFYSSSVGIKKTGFLLGFCMLFLTATTVFFAWKQERRIVEREYAIVITPSVTVKGAPDNSGTELFVVHEGLKVKIISSLGNWYNIRMSDGNEGWLPKPDLEKI